MEEQAALSRIAAALERIAPSAPEPVDWSAAPAFFWTGDAAQALPCIDAHPLSQLRGIETQKNAVRTNLERLASGAAAHDMLLWGARGMGKSALVRSGVESLHQNAPGKLSLVQIAPDALSTLPALIHALTGEEKAFLIYIDDLGFGAGDAQGNLALRSVLDGGVNARPARIRIAVTSNRRAIVQRNPDDAEALHERDERDNSLALADRFGLTLAFHPCDQATYLEIVRSYTDPLRLSFDEEEANAWAITRGSRSGRSAYQFACELAGRAGLPL